MLPIAYPMSFAIDLTSSKDLASLTPPPFPLPPACTCALTTHQEVPVSKFNSSAAATASSGVVATIPLDLTPKLFNTFTLIFV